MSEKFAKKALKKRAAVMTPETAQIEKEVYALMDKMDIAFGSFVYNGQLWTTYPPNDMDAAYHLIAAQVHCLSQAYELSPTTIMAEVNCAIKDVSK
ncbi:MAG: hypothetical protein IJP68_05805 [Selenomonadaceae bacterium]|nr:hypothetical protein [Selenomonadaceae bacterium]